MLVHPVAFSPCMLWWSKLPCGRGPCGKELRVTSSWHPVRNWDPHPNSHKELKTANNHLVRLEVDLSPVESFNETSVPGLTTWLQLSERQWSRGPSWAVPRFLLYRNCEIINVCCFKLLNFGIICYTAIDSYYSGAETNLFLSYSIDFPFSLQKRSNDYWHVIIACRVSVDFEILIVLSENCGW